jgi:hypothetical protein
MSTLVEKAGGQVDESMHMLKPYDNAICHTHNHYVVCDRITNA